MRGEAGQRYWSRLEAAREPRCGRREAAAGTRRWYPRVSLGSGGATRMRSAARGEKHGQDRVLFLCEKKAARPCVLRYLWSRRVQFWARPNTSCVCPRQAGLEHGCSAESAPARAGSDRDGRERPAADGRAGPFRPERTPFFPSHYVPSGLRSITGRTI